MKLDPLEDVLEDVRRGQPIVLIDDNDRENEGDITVAAEKVTPEIVNFMIQKGKGLICLSLPEERLRELGIPMQVTENTSLFGTNFAVSFDHRSVVEYGVSAAGRTKTILEAVNTEAKSEDFVMPGYVFPVAAVPGGVLKRRGQTEGSVDLALIAGLKPAGVICEVMGEDGLMLRGDELEIFCRRNGIKITSVEVLSQYRLHHEVSIRRVAEYPITQEMGLGRDNTLSEVFEQHPEIPFRIVVYVDDVDGKEHYAFVKGKPEQGSLVRMHSECLTGDVFESRRCDCGSQFDFALEKILGEGEGVLVYLHQEGRGIGLANKIRAYELQEDGLDTVDANLKLGFAADLRDYRVGAQILADLGVREIRVMTNNPHKVASLREFGISVSERVPIPMVIDEHSAAYLEAKRERLGHLFPTED